METQRSTIPPVRTRSKPTPGKWRVRNWLHALRWRPTSDEELLAAERRLLQLLKTPHSVERVDIGPSPPASEKARRFGGVSDKPRLITTVTVERPDADAGLSDLVMLHGFGGALGYWFRNFDFLAQFFRVHAIDQLGWGASSRPAFTCESTAEAEAWFVDSLEDWRRAKKLDSFVLLGHSFGGYVASRYALKYPERVKQLVLLSPAGFAPESEQMELFRASWRGVVLNAAWSVNTTPMTVVRAIGWWGPGLVRSYADSRFGRGSQGLGLSEEELYPLIDYMYHTIAARPSGELTLRHTFSLGGFAKDPLNQSAREWKVPTTFIYGYGDLMDYHAGRNAAQHMPVPAEVFRVPESGHFMFLENAPAFHAAVLQACRYLLPPGGAASATIQTPQGAPVPVPIQGEDVEDLPTGREQRLIKMAKSWKLG